MRNRDVIEFLGLWERLHNPNFKPLEFEGVRKQAGVNGLPKLEGYDKKLLEKEQKGEQSQKNGD